MTGLNDTHPEAERVHREAYRRMPFATRLHQMNVIYRTARFLHALGFRQRNPAATDEMVQDDWRNVVLGSELVKKVTEARRGAG